jgi:hypothetical protein
MDLAVIYAAINMVDRPSEEPPKVTLEVCSMFNPPNLPWRSEEILKEKIYAPRP